MNARVPLPPALPGQIREIASGAGRLAYYTNVLEGGAGAAKTAPLLLIHSINAAGSAYEVRPTYLYFEASRPVYALDLPGFGRSERSERPYVPRLMTDAIHAMVDEIRTRHRGMSGVYRIVASPLLRRRLFGLLTRRGTIRYFLQRTYGSKRVHEDMVEYDWHTTHQPGAERAPLYFLSGFLFSADVGPLYRGLRMPVWMSHGVRGDFVDYRRKSDVATRPNWRIDVFDSGALPHFERAREFHAKYEAFLGA
jgi:hypothetical protein